MNFKFDFKQFYLTAQGRVNRQQWWLRLVLPIFIISVVLTLIDVAIGTYDKQNGGGVLSGLFALAVLIPSILVDIKRWHDRDKSGWWMLILLVPIIGAIWAFSPVHRGRTGSVRRPPTDRRARRGGVSPWRF